MTGRHAALFYLLILNYLWLFSPTFAYSFSELIECASNPAPAPAEAERGRREVSM